MELTQTSLGTIDAVVGLRALALGTCQLGVDVAVPPADEDLPVGARQSRVGRQEDLLSEKEKG